MEIMSKYRSRPSRMKGSIHNQHNEKREIHETPVRPLCNASNMRNGGHQTKGRETKEKGERGKEKRHEEGRDISHKTNVTKSKKMLQLGVTCVRSPKVLVAYRTWLFN